MSVIRFNVDEVFNVDSSEYHILVNAALSLGDTPGAVVEIGTRRGGSAKMIIDALAQTNNTNRSMFCIDPYGNIEIDCTNINLKLHYNETVEGEDNMSKELSRPKRFDYTNQMRNRIIPSLYYYAFQAGLNFQFFCLEDTEFFSRYADGVPVYNDFKKIENQFALIFFDGPHTNEAIFTEMSYFVNKSPIGATWVFDDIWMTSHDDKIEPYLFDNGFELLEKEQIKASYRKTK